MKRRNPFLEYGLYHPYPHTAPCYYYSKSLTPSLSLWSPSSGVKNFCHAAIMKDYNLVPHKIAPLTTRFN